MAIPFAVFLLLSILSASALAYDFSNVTYRTCYDGDTALNLLHEMGGVSEGKIGEPRKSQTGRLYSLRQTKYFG